MICEEELRCDGALVLSGYQLLGEPVRYAAYIYVLMVAFPMLAELVYSLCSPLTVPLATWSQLRMMLAGEVRCLTGARANLMNTFGQNISRSTLEIVIN